MRHDVAPRACASDMDRSPRSTTPPGRELGLRAATPRRTSTPTRRSSSSSSTRDWFMVAEKDRRAGRRGDHACPTSTRCSRKMNGPPAAVRLVALPAPAQDHRPRAAWASWASSPSTSTPASPRALRRALRLGRDRAASSGGEMGWILETNNAMNRGMEAMGGRVVKRYRDVRAAAGARRRAAGIRPTPGRGREPAETRAARVRSRGARAPDASSRARTDRELIEVEEVDAVPRDSTPRRARAPASARLPARRSAARRPARRRAAPRPWRRPPRRSSRAPVAGRARGARTERCGARRGRLHAGLTSPRRRCVPRRRRDLLDAQSRDRGPRARCAPRLAVPPRRARRPGRRLRGRGGVRRAPAARRRRAGARAGRAARARRACCSRAARRRRAAAPRRRSSGCASRSASTTTCARSTSASATTR